MVACRSFSSLKDRHETECKIDARDGDDAVRRALPVKNTKDLIALAKSKPDALNYASTGGGSASHLAMESIHCFGVI